MKNEKPLIHLHDASTGTDQIREMTDEEVENYQQMLADSAPLLSAE